MLSYCLFRVISKEDKEMKKRTDNTERIPATQAAWKAKVARYQGSEEEKRDKRGYQRILDTEEKRKGDKWEKRQGKGKGKGKRSGKDNPTPTPRAQD